MEEEYKVIKKILLTLPDRDKLIKVLSLCDDSNISVVTIHALVKRSRISGPVLAKFLYLLTCLGALSIEKVGRASIYTVTGDIGGRFLDELKGADEKTC